MKSVLATYSDNMGCGFYRIKEPYSLIRSDVKFAISNNLDAAWDYDAVILQRPHHEKLPMFIKDYKKSGKKVIVDTDDDLFSIPESNPAKQFYTKEYLYSYRECLRTCDYIHTTTEYFKEKLEKEFGKKVILFPNAINLKKYVGKEEIRKKLREENGLSESDKVVAWGGSTSHEEDLLMIKKVIENLLDYGIKVVLKSNKEWLETLFSPNKNLLLLGWDKVEESYKFPAIADLFLVPLVDNEFNRSKSPLKNLEAWAWGVPTLFRQKDFDIDASDMDWEHYHKEGNLLRELMNPNGNLETVNKSRAAWWEKIL